MAKSIRFIVIKSHTDMPFIFLNIVEKYVLLKPAWRAISFRVREEVKLVMIYWMACSKHTRFFIGRRCGKLFLRGVVTGDLN